MGQIAPSCCPERIHPSHSFPPLCRLFSWQRPCQSTHGLGYWLGTIWERVFMWEKEPRGVINMLNWCASLSGFVANTNRPSEILMNSTQMDRLYFNTKPFWKALIFKPKRIFILSFFLLYGRICVVCVDGSLLKSRCHYYASWFHGSQTAFSSLFMREFCVFKICEIRRAKTSIYGSSEV